MELPPIVAEVRSALPGKPQVWLVGGAVRDVLLRRAINDLDFAISGDGLAAGRAVAQALRAPFYALDAERGVGRVLVDRGEEHLTLDFAQLRGADLAADLAGRDFAVNAMAISLDEPDVLVDPLGGERDLRDKLLRECGPNAIADDPVRGIRAVRLSAELGFRLDPATRAHVRQQAAAVGRASAERRRDEFLRCVAGPRPAGAVRALQALGLLPALVPELLALPGVTQSPPHVYDVWEHSLAALERLRALLALLGPVHDVDAASDLTLGLVSVRLGRHRQALDEHLNARLGGDRPVRWVLLLAALLHDVGKPATRSLDPDGRIRFFNHEQVGAELAGERLAALRLSNDEVQRARTIIRHHLRPLLLAQEKQLTRRAVYRFYRDTGPAGVDVALLSLADFLATHADGPPPVEEWNRLLEVVSRLLRAYFEAPGESVSPPALISGDDLMAEFGLEPGPRIGLLLDAVREAQAGGEVTDRATALAYVRQQLSQSGPLSSPRPPSLPGSGREGGV